MRLEERGTVTEEVDAAAIAPRQEQWAQAAAARGALGEPPSLVLQAEADLRVFVHDIMYPHHDKDVCSLSACPVTVLDDVCLHVWVMDYWGVLKQLVGGSMRRNSEMQREPAGRKPG